MINKIEIDKLFGRFDYEIVFDPKGVTIITGPNGYGKSTILRSIEALYEGDIAFFWKLRFQKLNIFFDTSKEIISISKSGNGIILNGLKIPVSMFLKDEDYKTRNGIFHSTTSKFWDKIPTSKLSVDEVAITPFYNEKEKIIDYSIVDNCNNVNQSDCKILWRKQYKRMLKRIRLLIGSIYFIKEQRLISQKKNLRDEKQVVNVIEDLPSKFKRLIIDISSDYLSIANKLDSTYPNRLFDTEVGISEDEYKKKMLEMTNKFEKLRKYDIFEMQNSANVFFKQEHAKALKVYFDDFNRKYEVYEDFIKKLDLFTDIINSRLSFKKIKISRENGIVIVDENCKDSVMKLNQLSSGEKQEIVLFYELIFETRNNTSLLIDEPEISLHIVWQRMFMDDLLKIVEYKGLKVIVATHSPQIINNHWDIQVDLGELYGNKLY
ncbi:AAA family ATPase [Clostridiaceae bacterium UIB06]|uniref:AAA family ATPase n=1 Tax=Clostridium thailandense TaxID=2794346 RepID=A0A949X0X7_9CLOT|nr:AAA family ATPase [Clostridium thailandense]MBV7271624.1 AAA family ATPase [Clostridium thailandense]MCH5136406.1 AAA family ATPase [Clostridiaceae bacterium UIB06]